jgi:CBS domain containing-hemolysin-like protein
VEGGSAFTMIVLLMLSAFFSASEVAYFSLSRIYLKKLEGSNTASAKRTLKLLKRPHRLLITLLLGNTFVNMALASLATLLVIQIAEKTSLNLSWMVSLQVVVTTSLILLFGEILPKLLALSVAGNFTKFAGIPLMILQYLLFPIVWLFEKLSNLVSKKQSDEDKLNRGISSDEFRNLIHSDNSTSSLDEGEKQILASLYRIREAQVSEIMVPRVKIQAINVDAEISELRELIIKTGYSRIPVFRETIDDIIGLVYVKDFILDNQRTPIPELMRPAWFVTENMKVEALLNQLKQRKMQLAVVVDEYGVTSGLVSLEDILEEIVGEIHDEFDQVEAPEILERSPIHFTVSGSCNIRQFNQQFDVDLDPEEYDNLAEYLLSHFNHVPAKGESHVLEDGLQILVMESDNKSIKTVDVHLPEKQEDEDEI